MITTITLNPCIDRTVMLPAVSPGEINLVEKSRSDIGGKGINLAVALTQLGLPVTCGGISFKGNNTQLYDSLDRLGIPYDFVVAPGDMRMNIKIVETSGNKMTELNSTGEHVSKKILDEFLGKLTHLGSNCDIVSLCGRLPNGAGTDYYKLCIEALSCYPVRVIVDAEGEPLKQAIQAKPYMIKPNAYELGTIFGREVHTVDEAAMLSRKIVDQGVEIVCCSLGDQGAIIAEKDSVWYAPALKIEPKGFQGAGDSMIAGICKAITEELPTKEMLRYGTAAAAASLIREGTLLCQKPDFESFLMDVEVIELI